MANTIDDYTKARKLGTKEYQKALSEGHHPYLPALDYMLGSRTTMAEEYVGIKEIPLSLVVGTVTQGRQDSFARNFMPILPPETEFGQKWMSLMDYQTSHGISDAIKATEFMGKFYVLEGNKRVSVLKFLGQPTIMAEVTRVLPPKSDDIEVIIYYEFLKFYKCTGIYDITFSESGCYEKLAEAVGKDLESPWDEDTVKDLKSAYLNFTTAYMGGGGKALSITIGDAFLIYIGIYKFESLINTPADEIKKNLTPIWQEIRIKANGDQIAFSEEPQLQKKTVIPIIDTLIKKPSYSEKNPLKILFLYDGDSSKSRWINGHEQGRKYLEEKFPGIVKTLTCDCKTTEEEFDEAVEAAAEDGADMIITTSPIQMEHTLRAAVKHPNIKFMNCSVHISHGAVRTYYGRMYEAKLVLGVLAATLSKDHRIGYVSTYPICGNIANINAFAIGAAMIDPEAKMVSVNYGKNPDYYLDAPIKITARFTIPSYAVKTTDGALLYKPVSGRLYNRAKTFLRVNTDLPEREFGFKDSCSRLVEADENVTVPKGMRLASPSGDNVSSDAADFSGKIAQTGSTVNISTSIALKKRVYEAEDYPGFKKAVEAWKTIEENTIVIK